MTDTFRRFGITALTIFWVTSSLLAQQKEHGDESSSSDTAKTNYLTSDVDNNLLVDKEKGFYFDFTNIGKEEYYSDERELRKINALRKEGDEIKLIEKLEEYVSKFGINNFSSNTDMLWELAQLYEKNNMMDRAKTAYRLVLKHHRREVVQEIQEYFKIKEHYNELTELEQDNYVPLDYYYELVEYRKAVDTLIPPHSVLLNMGELVNKENVRDYAASINAQDNFMIFTRRNLDRGYIGPKVKYNEDLYFSQGYGDFWDEAQEFPAPINSRCNEGSACVSKDGKTLFFTKCPSAASDFDCVDIIGECDLFYSTLKEDSTWDEPQNLGAQVNSVFWDSQPSLSPTEDTLYFASNRRGGFGLSDIYFTYKLKDGSWSSAQNLGPIINTRNNEYSPFLNKEHNVLYFSSNGHIFNLDDLEHNKTYITQDIYKSYFNDGRWNEPKNVGPLVNGEGNELYFTIDSKAKNLYYAKTEEGAEDNLLTDLFSFPVPMGAQPTATVNLKGMVVDEETGDPYQGIVSIIDLDNGIEVAPKNVRKDGTYEFDLIDHNNYLLVIQGDEFFRIEKLFELNGDTTIQTEAQSVKNRKLQFTSIVFENGKSNIREEMEDDLWDVVNFLVDNPHFHLTIAGHTDSDGNALRNKKLSQDRADAIKNFIMEKGYISDDRIHATGYGSDKPIRYPEESEEDKRINRRVEFEIIHEDNWPGTK